MYGQAKIKRQTSSKAWAKAPLTEVPPDMLKSVAIEAADWNLALNLEKKHSNLLKIFIWFLCIIVSIPLIIISYFLPDIEIFNSSSSFLSFLNHHFFFSSFIQPSSFLIFYSLVILGYFYVSYWTCGRDYPWYNRNLKSKDIFLLLLLLFPFFLLAPLFVLYSKHCPTTFTSHFTLRIFNPFLELLHPFVFFTLYNFIFFALPFWIGIQFTWLYNSFFLHNPSSINKDFYLSSQSSYRSKQFKFKILMALLTVLYLVFHISSLVLEKELVLGLIYGVVFCSIGIIGVVLILAMRKWRRKKFEGKYWMWCMVLMALGRFLNPVSGVCEGWLLGVVVEGVARWNLGSVLVDAEFDSSREKYLAWLSSPGWEDSLDQYTEHTDLDSDDPEATRSFVLDETFAPVQNEVN